MMYNIVHIIYIYGSSDASNKNIPNVYVCYFSTWVGTPKKAPTSHKSLGKMKGKQCILETCGGLFR